MTALALLLAVHIAGNVDAGPRPLEPVEPVEDVDAGAAAPSFSLQARVEPQPVAFGDEVRLIIEVQRPARMTLTVPDDVNASDELPRTNAKPMREARPTPDGGVKETITLSFLALDVKEQQTPSFTLTLGDDHVLEVPRLPVRVDVPALPDPSDGGTEDAAMALEPAAGTILYRVDDPRPFAILALFVVVVVAFLVVRAAILARTLEAPQQRGPPPPPPRPAHDVALERLDALMPMLGRGEVSVFVERVMDEVLRDYLAGRFALNAGTRTTKEIVTELLSVAATGLDISLVEAVGRDADLIKFARGSLSPEQAHAMAGRVRALIIATAEKTTATEKPT